MGKEQTIEEFVKELSASDTTFFGTKLNEDNYKRYERIKYFAKEIKANENYFINVHIECQEELTNAKPNGIVIVNILAPANINNKVIKDCLSKMIDLSDNLSIAVTEREAHKIIRFGFGVRDIWVDARGGN
jgi:hypothetical protein